MKKWGIGIITAPFTLSILAILILMALVICLGFYFVGMAIGVIALIAEAIKVIIKKILSAIKKRNEEKMKCQHKIADEIILRLNAWIKKKDLEGCFLFKKLEQNNNLYIRVANKGDREIAFLKIEGIIISYNTICAKCNKPYSDWYPLGRWGESFALVDLKEYLSGLV